MRSGKDFGWMDKAGLSLSVGVLFVFLLIGYEIAAHGVELSSRAFAVIVLSGMVAAWLTAISIPNEL